MCLKVPSYHFLRRVRTDAFWLENHGSFDSFAYECAREFKSVYKRAALVFVTPYLNQEYINKKADLYDTIIYPEIENKPKKYAILERNKYMIKKSDIVIAYVEHSWGGAYKSLLIAKKANKKIYNLADK